MAPQKRLAFLALCLVVATCLATSRNHIENLPGLSPSVNITQYSGYLTVDKTNNRNLFYWFVECQGKLSTSCPLVLWLNGGPGCSSLIAVLSENGPFWPDAEGNLAPNMASWTLHANVLYLESPAGVGFSYSDVASDYVVGDARTTDDAFVALQQFLVAFPEYNGADFTITGESYAGHYVPLLVQKVLQNPGALNLKLTGMMVGNPWTDTDLDNTGAVETWFTHAMISDTTYAGIISQCNLSSAALWVLPYGGNSTCNELVATALKEIGPINMYDIYELVCPAAGQQQGALPIGSNVPVDCTSDKAFVRALALARAAQREAAEVETSDGDATITMSTSTSHPLTPGSPCVDNYLTDFLNSPDVQAALHVNRTVQWVECTTGINYSCADAFTSMLPVYQYLLTQNIRMLIYSGDCDSIVPTPGTRLWLAALNLTTLTPWHPWLVGQQVGGYAVEYAEDVTFVTVRGAGHLVPQTQPVRALEMFLRFVTGKGF